ncbi:glycosyltransferase [Aquilutibacter rugosus]|uniref:glycosyltransferase n=1 Tax=Aquilutibacter rugosus TaxID=3115820 RepID=UPI002F42EEB0
MRRQRTIAFGFIGLIVLSSLLVLGFSILTLQRDGGSLTIILENTVLRMVAIYLLFILVVLILRYSITILLSYLEHINIVSRRDSSATEANDLSLPMISLVVPAYNEGVLIEAALKALLNLDYPNYEIIVVDDGSSDDTYYKALRISETSADVPVRVLPSPMPARRRP